MVTEATSETVTNPYLDQAQAMIDNQDVQELADVLYAKEILANQVETPEAVGSCSTYIVGPGGTEVLITSRGASLEFAWEQLKEFLQRRIAQGFKPVIKGKAQPMSDAPLPTVTTKTDGGTVTTSVVAGTTTTAAQQQDDTTIPLTKLYAQVNGDKVYWKVEGGRFKFPITIWPEVITAAGIDITKLEVGKVADMTGWMGEFVRNDKGNPQKIVRMWKP